MKEVSGTEITVTKKATVIKLDQQPTVINNNQQELFSKAPGFPLLNNRPQGSLTLVTAASVTPRNRSLSFPCRIVS